MNLLSKLSDDNQVIVFQVKWNTQILLYLKSLELNRQAYTKMGERTPNNRFQDNAIANQAVSCVYVTFVYF